MPEFQITYRLGSPDLIVRKTEVTKLGDLILTLESKSSIDSPVKSTSGKVIDLESMTALQQVPQNSDLEAYLRAIVHDLRNPLSTIIGFADMLARERHKFPEERIDKFTDEILRAGEKIDDMLKYLSQRAKGLT